MPALVAKTRDNDVENGAQVCASGIWLTLTQGTCRPTEAEAPSAASLALEWVEPTDH